MQGCKVFSHKIAQWYAGFQRNSSKLQGSKIESCKAGGFIVDQQGELL